MRLGDIEDIRTFVLVAELGSLSKAAKQLGISVNAVSRRISKLETALGVHLLQRTTRSLSLTSHGCLFEPHARRVVDEIRMAQERIFENKSEIAGNIKIAIPGIASSLGIMSALNILLGKNDKLSLDVRVINRHSDVPPVGFDVVLCIGLPKDGQLVAKKLFSSSNWVLAASPSYFQTRERPATPRDLLDHNCLRFAWGHATNKWVLNSRDHETSEVEVHGNFEADDSRVLRDAIYSGIGIGLRPKEEVQRAKASGKLVHVLSDYHFAPVDVYALCPKDVSKTPRVATFLDAFANALVAEA